MHRKDRAIETALKMAASPFGAPDYWASERIETQHKNTIKIKPCYREASTARTHGRKGFLKKRNKCFFKCSVKR